MDLPKRDRSSNFTEDEAYLLVKLVVKYINIIENKHADAATWKHKELTWDCITNEFKRETNNKSAVREVKNLKIKYESMKKIIRKKIAEAKKLKDYEQELFRHLVAENDFGLAGNAPAAATVAPDSNSLNSLNSLSSLNASAVAKESRSDPLEMFQTSPSLIDVQIKTEAEMDLEEDFDYEQDSSNGGDDSIQNVCLQLRKAEAAGHSKNSCCENLRADLRKFIDTSKVFMEIEMENSRKELEIMKLRYEMALAEHKRREDLHKLKLKFLQKYL